MMSGQFQLLLDLSFVIRTPCLLPTVKLLRCFRKIKVNMREGLKRWCKKVQNDLIKNDHISRKLSSQLFYLTKVQLQFLFHFRTQVCHCYFYFRISQIGTYRPILFNFFSWIGQINCFRSYILSLQFGSYCCEDFYGFFHLFTSFHPMKYMSKKTLNQLSFTSFSLYIPQQLNIFHFYYLMVWFLVQLVEEMNQSVKSVLFTGQGVVKCMLFGF